MNWLLVFVVVWVAAGMFLAGWYLRPLELGWAWKWGWGPRWAPAPYRWKCRVGFLRVRWKELS